jgi:hypothetical protein
MLRSNHTKKKMQVKIALDKSKIQENQMKRRGWVFWKTKCPFL